VLRKAQALDRFDWQQMSWNDRQYVEHQLDPVKLGDRVWQVLTEPDPGQSAATTGRGFIV